MTHNHRHTHRRRPRRRGMATILVLGMISMTLAVSYALVRTQTALLGATNNADLRADAREAAFTGISTAMRRMNLSSWGGADSSFTGTISPYQTFGVTYATGDESLPASGSGAEDWPYRVTIRSTGYVVNPSATSATTTYTIEAVVRLAPKAVAANPSPWASMQQYSLYQTDNQNVSLQWPFRINGAARFQGGLTTLFSSYPSPSAAHSRYFTDLNAMRTNGYGDFRPFSGPIYMPFSATTTTNRSLLSSNLGLVLTNSAAVTTTNWSHPGSVSSYQLYAGGKTFTVQTLPSTVTGTAYQADPRTNPAGLFYRSGTLTLGSHTQIIGTILGGGKVRLSGTNISVQAAAMPALDGSTQSVQLPAIVAGGDLEIADGSNSTIRGNTITFGELSILNGSSSTRLDLQGRVILDDLDIRARTDWSIGGFWWSLLWTTFNNQLGSSGAINYFPVYAQAAFDLNYSPQLNIGPQSGNYLPQWFSSGNPVYAVGNGDSGLRWSLVRVVERP